MIRACVAVVTGGTGRAVADAVEAAGDVEFVAGFSHREPMTVADYDEIDAAARDNGVGVIAAGNFSVPAGLLLRSAPD